MSNRERKDYDSKIQTVSRTNMHKIVDSSAHLETHQRKPVLKILKSLG